MQSQVPRTQPLSKIRNADALLQARAEHAFGHTDLAPELKGMFAGGFADATLQHPPTITNPDQSRNSAAYCAGYRAGQEQQSCPQCGAIKRPSGECDFCPPPCLLCDAPWNDVEDKCANPDCETNR